MRKVRVLKSEISVGSYKDFIEQFIGKAQKRESSYVCIANVHMTIEAFKDESFREVMNNADVSTPDGMPIAKAIRLLHGLKQDRVAGMDLFPDLLKASEEKELNVFLYGSSPEVLSKIDQKIKKNYPSLKVVGIESPPFRELSQQEEESYIQQINRAETNILFVALGCPKQEKWMAKHKGLINSVMLGVGGAFPVYAETVTRAPNWMQKIAMEWFYRLLQEPRRLFKRYFVTNSLFLIYLFVQFINRKAFRAKK